MTKIRPTFRIQIISKIEVIKKFIKLRSNLLKYLVKYGFYTYDTQRYWVLYKLYEEKHAINKKSQVSQLPN